MARPTHRISTRKEPKQKRSSALVSTILEAAIQVLAEEGAQRFTTARVAERAGVSIGSLYQYFPNKAAILFRLQIDEWRQTTDLLCSILGDTSRPALVRLRELVIAFLRSEHEEAAVRGALADAAPLYRDAPEAKEARNAADSVLKAFMKEVLPQSSDALRTRACDLIMTTMSTVCKELSDTPRSPEEIELNAGAMADMFCAYLESLQDL